MELATIQTDEDLKQMIIDLGGKLSENEFAWIGGQKYFNSWIWLPSGRIIKFKYFYYNQPDDRIHERCIVLNWYHELEDFNCNDKFKFICQKIES